MLCLITKPTFLDLSRGLSIFLSMNVMFLFTITNWKVRTPEQIMHGTSTTEGLVFAENNWISICNNAGHIIEFIIFSLFHVNVVSN